MVVCVFWENCRLPNLRKTLYLLLIENRLSIWIKYLLYLLELMDDRLFQKVVYEGIFATKVYSANLAKSYMVLCVTATIVCLSRVVRKSNEKLI